MICFRHRGRPLGGTSRSTYYRERKRRRESILTASRVRAKCLTEQASSALPYSYAVAQHSTPPVPLHHVTSTPLDMAAHDVPDVASNIVNSDSESGSFNTFVHSAPALSLDVDNARDESGPSGDDGDSTDYGEDENDADAAPAFAEQEKGDKLPFHVALSQIALQNCWSHKSLRDVLQLLRGYEIVPDIPKDPRTVLGTPRLVTIEYLTADKTKQYYHFGLQHSLDMLFPPWPDCVTDGCVLQLQLNMDGLPIAESDVASVHPILGRIHLEAYQSNVFCIGIYFGKEEKPDDSHMLLRRFREDYMSHKQIGYVVGDRRLFVDISAVICDKVERDLVKETKGHSGYSTCDKCETHGVWDKHVVYPDLTARLRTDESFRLRRHPDHHRKEIKDGIEVLKPPSALELCNVGMVTQFPLDIMHMVFMGVTKKMLTSWMPGPKCNYVKFGKDELVFVSDSIVLNVASCPSNFQRRPRQLKYYKHFKATEFRSFLLYVGPVILRSKLDTTGKQYRNFLLLAVGMRILLNDRLRRMYLDTAERMLVTFVSQFRTIYGECEITYNIHSIIHLAHEARLHGNLNNVNSFPFESHLGRMRKQLRRSGYTLQQMVKREFEHRHIAKLSGNVDAVPEQPGNTFKFLKERRQDGLLPPDIEAKHVVQFAACRYNGVRYSSCPRDRIVSVNGRIGQIRNIVQDSRTEQVWAVISFYRQHADFFTYPLCSSKVGILEVSDLRKSVVTVDLHDCVKAWLVHRQDGATVAVELLH